MTTFYLDPVSGNDANNGTTFANRWKTFTSGATAARIAPTDTIRVIANTDATDMAQTGTWAVEKVTLTSAVTQIITLANTAWTASANVAVTTSTNRKISTTSSSIAPAAAFTTGKAAYLNLGTPVDLSAYQQVCFWINMTAGTMAADGNITLRLCSDTTGDVTVHTISIPRIYVINKWTPVVVDLGSALSSSIQSVALYVAVDNAAQTFLINNIFASKAPSADDSLTLNSLIGADTLGGYKWVTIQSINDTAVVFEQEPSSNQPNTASIYPVWPTTGSLSVWKMEPLVLPSSSLGTPSQNTVFGLINDSGTSGSPITISGGWNRTDMSTQTGESYISGGNNTGNVFSAGVNTAYINIDKISLIRFDRVLLATSSIGWNVTNMDLAGLLTGSTGVFSNTSISIRNIMGGQSIAPTIYWSTYSIDFYSGKASQTTMPVSGVFSKFTLTYATNMGNISNYNVVINASNLQNSVVNIGNITARSNFLIATTQSSTTTCDNNVFNLLDTLTISPNSVYYVFSAVGGSNNKVFCNGRTPANFTASSQSIGNILYDGSTAFLTSALTNSSNVTFVNCPFSAPPSFTDTTACSATFANADDITTDQRIYYPSVIGTILTDSTTVHTAGGISWKMTSGVNPNADFPLALPVAKIACNSSALVTAKIWVYRTDTTLTTKFVCAGGQITGVASDVVATAGGAINTWEELTITFTPTQQGVVELQVDCYGAAASVYVDDFSVSQA